MPVKHIPVRTCCGCGLKSDKRGMVRIVRSPEGSVSVDTTGKASGRGAYLCEDSSCWDSGINRSRLERTLNTKIGSEQRTALLAYAEEQKPNWVA
jgi:predicted RNA-binding protein YlxR (DUF448 family)